MSSNWNTVRGEYLSNGEWLPLGREQREKIKEFEKRRDCQHLLTINGLDATNQQKRRIWAEKIEKFLSERGYWCDKNNDMWWSHRNLGFEISREPASFRHLHIPPQGAEYTLTHCPVFWGHLR